MFAPRGGLENTVFAIMDAKRTKYLGYPSRMPYETFPGCENDPSIMAKGLDAMAKPFASSKFPESLPIVKGVKFGLNVAACDRRPAVIISGNEGERAKWIGQLQTLSWSQPFIGQFVYCENPSEKESSVRVVQPDEYGVKASNLSKAIPGDDLSAALSSGLSKFKPWENDHRSHLRRAVQQGIRWRPAVPVEDRQANEATKRLWGD